MKQNRVKDAFLKTIPEFTIELSKKKFEKIAFSLQFFDNSQSAGQHFNEWTHDHLVKLLEKLKQYCAEDFEHWKKMRIGSGKNHVLEIHGNFPNNSDFSFPSHVPVDVKWGRFRLEGDMRLVGFIIDGDSCKANQISPNVFYIVFLDAFHRFYKVK